MAAGPVGRCGGVALWCSALSAVLLSAAALCKERVALLITQRQHDHQAASHILKQYNFACEEAHLMRRTLLDDLHRKLDALFPVEQLMQQIETSCKETTEKIQLWSQLKIEVVTRMLACYYSMALLDLFVTIAMAIIGRSLFLRGMLREQSSLLSSSDQADNLSSAHRMLMSIATHFIQHGLSTLTEALSNSTVAILGKVDLQERISRSMLDTLLAQIRHEIDTACGRDVLEDCLFGKLDDLVGVDVSPRRRRLFLEMLVETKEHFRSEFVHRLVVSHIDGQIGTLLDGICKGPPSSIPLITIIPHMARAFHTAFQPSASSPSGGTLDRHLDRIFAAIFADHQASLSGTLLSKAEKR